MGLFKRKDSKTGFHSDKDELESFVSTSSTRTSNGSLKLSMSMKSGNELSSPVPGVRIETPPDPNLDPAAYLRSIHAVRERSRVVMQKAKKNQLNHFDVDLTKFSSTAQYVVSIIKVCAGFRIPKGCR
jgi:hypothetical protein